MSKTVRAGIIGGGFMGSVHAHAVRATGGIVTYLAGSTPESARAAALRLHAAHAATCAEELINADEVDVVHICTPNVLHASLAEQAVKAGKHVICEKPLATTVDDARDIYDAATEAGVMAAVPFVYRYYPIVREIQSRIANNEAGDLRLLHGSYLQDWLSSRDDTNWRVDPSLGGGSRAFADIGVHWCDLMEFTTGHRITRVTARFVTAHGERRNDAGLETVTTEDGATVLFETDKGAYGSVVLSQVSLGRKNRLWFSWEGTAASYVFDQESPDSLWVGGRTVTSLVPRGPETLSAAAQPYVSLPAGHPQGYQDCFNAFISECYAAIRGDVRPGMPTFADGLRAASITAAVLESAGTGGWIRVEP